MRTVTTIVLIIVLLVTLLTSCNNKKIPEHDNVANKDPNKVSDVDGNVYKTVKIGNQWWMAENLKVTHYRDGSAIPKVTSNSRWSNLKSGAYCAYNNKKSNSVTFGYLYNWYAVNDSRNIVPLGWHVPNNEDWITLINYLGGEASAGSVMKEKGIENWGNNNMDATNDSCFSALPSGYRSGNGKFFSIGLASAFWSTTEYDRGRAWRVALDNYGSEVSHFYYFEQHGFSVRLVKD